MTRKRLYFLWDYDLTEEDVRQILRGDNHNERTWMIARILESARFEDVWNFVSLREVVEIFPSLKLKPEVKKVWANALEVWAGT